MTVPKVVEKYLGRCEADGRRLQWSRPDAPIDQAVVIPALAEGQSLFDTLASLCGNPPEDLRRTLILCVVNNRRPGVARSEDIAQNRRTLDRLGRLIDPGGGRYGGEDRVIRDAAPNLACLDASSPGMEMPDRGGGVGMARKLGMDRALRLFPYSGSGPHLLFSLDADTTVEPGYLPEARRFFEARKCHAAVVGYAHRAEGDGNVLAAICCYEIFLRYYSLGLRFAGSPYAYPAIGSTMVCRADSYAAVRGMNRREAGEDFYFLNKLAKLGDVGQMDGTTVYPSARPSNRVPFGTGRRVIRFLEGHRNEYILYHPEIFEILRKWLEMMSRQGDRGAEVLLSEAARIHPLLQPFLERLDFPEIWPRIRRNHRGGDLSRHFHVWFDGFKTLKLVHFLTEEAFPPLDMFRALGEMLARNGDPYPGGMEGGVIPSPGEQRKILDFLRRRPLSPVLP